MIRMVQMDYFAEGRVTHVSFYDTVVDQYITIYYEQCWDSLYALLEACKLAGVESDFITRLQGLCPIWFLRIKEKHKDD